jgi:hypothetical protein
MFSRNSNIAIRLATHFFMGVSVGLAFLIVLMTANIGHIADLLASPVDQGSTAMTLSMYVAISFGAGAMITGAVFEVMQQLH